MTTTPPDPAVQGPAHRLDGCREIPLTQGRVAVVDEADYEWLSRWKWYAQRCGGAVFYARRRRQKSDGEGPSRIHMHREILGVESLDVDHVDGDGLNNRRANLRPASDGQNSANKRLYKNSATGFKGVCVDRETGKYRAYIQVERKWQHLGMFDCPKDAARAYDAAARELFGEYARPNFQEGVR